jgi:hypothetical protein
MKNDSNTFVRLNVAMAPNKALQMDKTVPAVEWTL